MFYVLDRLYIGKYNWCTLVQSAAEPSSFNDLTPIQDFGIIYNISSTPSVEYSVSESF